MNISLKRSRRRLAPAGVVLLLVALFGSLVAQGCASAQGIRDDQQETERTVTVDEVKPVPGPEVGQLAPDFTLTDLQGNRVSLSDFRGKTVFLNFWATWCPPCRAEMPEIEAVYQKYKERDVVVIGVDLFEPEDVVREFVQKGGYSWLFVIDTTGEVTRNYRVSAIPTSFFLDREGVIRGMNLGAMTQRAIEARLAEAMR